MAEYWSRHRSNPDPDTDPIRIRIQIQSVYGSRTPNTEWTDPISWILWELEHKTYIKLLFGVRLHKYFIRKQYTWDSSWFSSNRTPSTHLPEGDLVFSRKQGFVKTQPVPTVHCAPKSNVEENKEVPTKKNSVADPGCLSRILDLNFFLSRIQHQKDSRSRILDPDPQHYLQRTLYCIINVLTSQLRISKSSENITNYFANSAIFKNFTFSKWSSYNKWHFLHFLLDVDIKYLKI